MRKSKREKEKEAAEAKRREEEQNAAKAYAEFLDAFEGEGVDRRKAGSGFVKAGQESTEVYNPSLKGKGQSSRTPGMFQDEPSVSAFVTTVALCASY